MHKYLILFLIVFIIPQEGFSQAYPGGVSANIKLWVKADAGVTSSGEGTKVTAWADQSGNAYNLSQGTSGDQPLVYTTTVSKLINFNPSIDFNGSESVENTGAIFAATSDFSFIVVATDEESSTSRQALLSATDNDLDFNIEKDGGATTSNGWELFLETHGTDNVLFPNGGIGFSPSGGSNGYYNGANYTSDGNTQIIVPQIVATTGKVGVGQIPTNYLDGNAYTHPVDTETDVDYFQSITVGADFNGGYDWDGRILEVIAYDNDKTAAEMLKINSYLGIKYGITLGQSGTSTSEIFANVADLDYQLSDASVIWDASTNTTYKYHIAGIGRDDGSALDQEQSQSQNPGFQPIIGNASEVNTTNAAHTGSFSTDKDFEVWGCDGASVNFATAYVFGNTNYRMTRIWKVEESGTVGTVKVAALQSEIAATSAPTLLVSNDATFDGTDSQTLMASETIGGLDYWTTTVNFTDGQFFTFAAYIAYPGGVTGEVVWLKTDYGVTSSGDGTDVTNWADASGNGYDVAQGTVGDRPEYYSTTAAKLINFNPSIDYTNNEFLKNTTPLMAATSDFSFFVAVVDENTVADYNTIFACDDLTNTFSFYKQGGASGDNGWNIWAHVAGPYETNPSGVGFSGTSGDNGYYNGANYTSDANTNNILPQIAAITGTPDGSTHPVTYIDGNQDDFEDYFDPNGDYFQGLGIGAEVACSGCEAFTGRIPEFIAYDRQISAAETQRVNSYLSIKYGTTLGQGGGTTTAQIFCNYQDYDYQASDASVIWDASVNTTYKYHIAGIGRDDNSGLDQEQSQSQNPDFHPIIGNDSEVTTSNAAHSGSFSADKSFLIWGCDGASTRFTSAFAFGNLNYRMVRIWKVQESGTVGTVKVAIAKSDVGILTDPALLVSTDATFDGTDTRTDMTEESIGGIDYYTALYDFTDGDYFTFGHYQTYPGGVTGTVVWHKADEGVTNTGEGGNVSEWTDASNNGYHVEQTTGGDQPEYYGTTASKLINFNPSIEFTNNEFLENNTPLMAATSDFSFFVAVVDENTVADYNTIFACDDLTNTFSFYKQGGASGDNGWNIWAHVAGPYETNPSGVGFSATGGDNGYYNGTNYTSDANTKNILPQIAAITGTPDGVTHPVTYIDGNQDDFEDYFDPNGDYFQELGIGAEVSCSGCEAFTGRIPEFFAYDANLSSAQVQKINTYLAIKYGVTLGQGGGTTTAQIFCNYQDYDYQATDATVVWDASANSTFKYDIAGIARDDAEALDQRISKSSNPNVDVVTIALDNDFSSANQDAGRTNTHVNDLSYLIWGNNYGATTFSTTYNTSLTSRMTRKWKIQKTNFLDSVFVQATDGDIANSTEYALIGNTSTAETGWKQICKATSAGAGNTITFENADFINFDYFSLSSVIETEITLGSTIPADDICPDATTVPIYRGTITTDAEGCSGDIDIETFNFTTTGTFVAADISKYQLWVNSVDDLGTATQIDDNSLTPTGPAGTKETFTISGSTNFSLSSTYYFWITADIASSPGVHTIIVNAINPRNITFNCGSVVGTGTVGGTQTILGEVIWDGGGADNNWTTAANWVDDIAPVADLTLNFAGATRTSPVNDFAAGTNFNAIEFDAAASSFTLSGNAITITSGCNYPAINAMNNANTMLIENDITFSTNAPTIISTTDGTLNITGTMDNGGFTITNTCAGSNTYSDVISGAGGFIKNSAGPLTLSAANTFSGGVTLNAGRLNIDNNSALGAEAGTFTINGGTINSTTSANNTNDNPIAWDGDFSFLGTTNLDLGDGTITLGASRQVTTSASTLTLGGIINHNTFDLTKAGAGTLSFDSQAITLKDLTINAGTLVASSGVISLSGDYYNDGTFTHNSGTLTFNGAVDQGITGGSSETFNNLVINNSGTAPTNNINVGNPIDLVSNLTLTDGIVKTSDPAGLLTLLAGSTSDPGSIDSFVDGPMQKTGTTAFVFPLGDADRWARIGIGTPTGSETYKAEYRATPYSDLTTMASNPTPALYSVSAKENWELTRSGSEDATVTLYWEDADWSGISDCGTSDLRIGHWNGSAWENNNNSVSTTGGCTGAVAGTVSTVADVTSFSPFTFATLNLVYNPLPIELLYFEALYNGESVDLNWETASETNNDYFTLERSIDGVNFEIIKLYIPSKAKTGNSTSVLNYFSKDETVSSGIYYYRLKQIDFNGNFAYSSIEIINIAEDQKFSFHIAPNPNNGSEINFIIHQEGGQETTVIITDILGQELYSKVFVAEQNGTKIYPYVPEQKLAEGAYLVSAISDQKIISKRLIVNY